MIANTNIVKVVLVLAVVAAGASLKISRYAAAHAAIPLAAVETIVRTMSAHGWSLVSQSEAATATLYDHLSFHKPGCETTVTIAAMGGNAEAAEFFRQRYGGNAAFIQGDDVVERPSGVRRQFAILTQHARMALGLQTSRVAPILAISPAPPASQSNCQGPPVNAWRRTDSSQVNTSSIANIAVEAAELRR
jgi:hypothetical protein